MWNVGMEERITILTSLVTPNIWDPISNQRGHCDVTLSGGHQVGDSLAIVLGIKEASLYWMMRIEE